MAIHIGEPTKFPIYKTETIGLGTDNLATYFTIENDSPYYFEASPKEGILVSNNKGVKNSTAHTKLIAKRDMDIACTYTYSSEEKYDKFTLKVGDTVVEDGVSGATMMKNYSASLKSGQSIDLTYKKDSSTDKNDDECWLDKLSITIKTQTGTETKSVAREVIKMNRGVSGVAREISSAYRGVSGVSRQFFGKSFYIVQTGQTGENAVSGYANVWDDYKYSSSKPSKITKADEYIEIYSEGYYGVAMLFANDLLASEPGFDTSGYSKLNIEFDVKGHLYRSGYKNYVRIGYSNKVLGYLGKGSTWKPHTDLTYYKSLYEINDTTADKDFVTVTSNIDISSYDLGKMVVYVWCTSWNYSDDYTYCRIKKIWFS